jgi:hypothetical protein
MEPGRLIAWPSRLSLSVHLKIDGHLISHLKSQTRVLTGRLQIFSNCSTS